MSRSLWSIWLALVLGCISLSLSGCLGSKADRLAYQANSTNVKRLSNLYNYYQNANAFKGPKNEEDFKNFINSQGKERLERVGVTYTNVDELFVSERDRQPFRIRYGINTRVRGPAIPVIFESAGVGGTIQVGFTTGQTEEVDASEADDMFAGKKDAENPEVEYGRQ
jgi:hypothetical protein